MTTITIDKTLEQIIADKTKGLRKKDTFKSQEKRTVTFAEYSGCMPADAHWRIPVSAGKRFEVFASIQVGCDSRGWSCDNWATSSGPQGVPGYYVQGSLGHPNAPIGMLIGAVHPDNVGDMDSAEAQRVFANNTLLVGSEYR